MKQKKISRGLIIEEKWLNKIFRKHKKKTWEIRCSKTAKREKIALIQMGSNKIVGTCEIVDVTEHLSPKELKRNKDKHQATIQELKKLKCKRKKKYAWILENANKYTKPRTYKHKRGAQIWVKL